jgi:hypothetical protein
MHQKTSTRGAHIQVTVQLDNDESAHDLWDWLVLHGLHDDVSQQDPSFRVNYYCCAYEQVGHRHIHIYVQFLEQHTLGEYIEYIGAQDRRLQGSHVEVCHGSVEANCAYLRGGPPSEKEPREEWQKSRSLERSDPSEPMYEVLEPNRYYFQSGQPYPDGAPVLGKRKNPGERTDLERVHRDIVEGMSWEELESTHPKAIIMYHKSLTSLYSYHLQKRARSSLQATYSTTSLREWQSACLKNLDSQNSRQIHWYWDSKGNTGKTWLCHYLVALKGYVYLESGPRRDLAHALSVAAEDSTVAGICVDLTKSFGSSVDGSDLTNRLAPILSLIESAKNGMVYSGKYSSKVIYLNNCKVLIVANFVPDLEQREKLLSLDRWNVINIVTP